MTVGRARGAGFESDSDKYGIQREYYWCKSDLSTTIPRALPCDRTFGMLIRLPIVFQTAPEDESGGSGADELHAALILDSSNGAGYDTQKKWSNLSDDAVRLHIGEHLAKTEIVTCRPEDRAIGMAHWVRFQLSPIFVIKTPPPRPLWVTAIGSNRSDLAS